MDYTIISLSYIVISLIHLVIKFFPYLVTSLIHSFRLLDCFLKLFVVVQELKENKKERREWTTRLV